MHSTRSTTISCQCCSRSFSDPRLLPCLHVFCKTCLEAFYSQDEETLTCPTCNKVSSCPLLAQLPKHRRIERESKYSRMKEEYSQASSQAVCGNCDNSNKAEAYCEDCSVPVCSECISGHKLLKITRNHAIISFEHSQPETTSVRQCVACILHPDEAVKYYCSTCSCLVCSECLFAHKEHDSDRIDSSQLLEKEKAELQSSLPEVEKVILHITEAVDNISTVIKHIQTNENKAREEIDEMFKLFVNTLDKRRYELTEEVKSSAMAKLTQLELQKEELEKLSAGLRLVMESGMHALNEDYSAVEVLAVKGSIHQASTLYLQQSQSTDLNPVSNSGLKVVIDTGNIIQSISSIGSVIVNSAHPPHCSIIGIDPKLAIGVAKGTKCVLTLQTRDEKGEDLTDKMAPIVVTGKVIDSLSKSEVHKCATEYIGNGKHKISFENPVEGQYQLDIKVDNHSIYESPLTINVRDYTTIQRPTHTIKFGVNPSFVGIGPKNERYVTFDTGCVEVYNHNYQKIREILESKLGCLKGMAFDEKSGIMFIANADGNEIVKASLEGEVLSRVGTKGSGQLQFRYPLGLCLTKEGLLLVAGNSNKRIQVLGSDLSFIRIIPCRSNVIGVSVDGEGNIHATATNRVEVFNINGEKITEYGQGVLTKTGDVAFLKGSKSQYSFVTDFISNGKVYIFDWRKNKLIKSIDAGMDTFGFTIDQEGKIIVCCWSNKTLLQY